MAVAVPWQTGWEQHRLQEFCMYSTYILSLKTFVVESDVLTLLKKGKLWKKVELSFYLCSQSNRA